MLPALPSAGRRSSSITFALGETFRSYEEVEVKVKEYEKANFVQLWKREARTIASAQKRVERYMKPELKYYQLKYCCIHGGKRFRPGGSGLRETM